MSRELCPDNTRGGLQPRRTYTPTAAGLSESLEIAITSLYRDAARGQAGVPSLGSQRLDRRFVEIDQEHIKTVLEAADKYKLKLKAEPLSEAAYLMEKFDH